MSRAIDAEESGLSFGQQHVGRALLTPDEVRTLRPDRQLLFLAGRRPIVARSTANQRVNSSPLVTFTAIGVPDVSEALFLPSPRSWARVAGNPVSTLPTSSPLSQRRLRRLCDAEGGTK